MSMTKGKLLKAYPFLEEVDSFSLDVAMAIYKVRPHWLNAGKVNEFNGNKYLSIKIVSPKHSDWHINFNTDSHDITVAYYYSFHVHFNRASKPLEFSTKNAFNLIDSLMKEQLVVGFILFQSNNPVGHAYDVENIPTTKTDEVHYIRSWLGTYDKNLLEE